MARRRHELFRRILAGRVQPRSFSQSRSLASATTLRCKLAKASLRGEGQDEGGLPMKSPLTPAARRLRGDATDAEALLWRSIRNRQLSNFKFKRQVPQGPYVVDFLCIEAKLIVEVDGGQHAVNAGFDEKRTQRLETDGYRVLRFWNNDVLRNLSGVLETIASALPEKSPLTQPSPRGERAFQSGPTTAAVDSGAGEGNLPA